MCNATSVGVLVTTRFSANYDLVHVLSTIYGFARIRMLVPCSPVGGLGARFGNPPRWLPHLRDLPRGSRSQIYLFWPLDNFIALIGILYRFVGCTDMVHERDIAVFSGEDDTQPESAAICMVTMHVGHYPSSSCALLGTTRFFNTGFGPVTARLPTWPRSHVIGCHPFSGIALIPSAFISDVSVFV